MEQQNEGPSIQILNCTMVNECKKNPSKRRKARSSRTKLLCAAGLTLWDLTVIDAAKSDGYFSDRTPSVIPTHPAIDKNNTSYTVGADKVSRSVDFPSDLDGTSTRRSGVSPNLQRGTLRLSQTSNPSEHLSDAPNRPINGLPRPPPHPQWIRDNRFEPPPENVRQQPSYRQATFDTQATSSNRKYKRDGDPNVNRDNQISSPNYATNIRVQRRVPLHLQHAPSGHRPTNFDNARQQQQQQRTISPTVPPYESRPDDYEKNTHHARSYQSRIMPQHQSEYPRAIPEPNKERWTRAVMEQSPQHHPLAAVSPNRSGVRSLLREPTVKHQPYTRGGTPMMSSSSSPAVVDNSVVSLVADPFTSQQLAIIPSSLHGAVLEEQINQVQSLVEAGAWLSWGSIQKISWCLLAISLLSYAAVSPSTLPLTEYNLQFYENLRIVCLSTIAPAMYMSLVFDPRENDVNSVTNVFVVTFFLGYVGIYVLELVATTMVRLLLFIWLEPNVFSLMPRIPLPVLPWVLRECQYRPKRITLFAADFATSCIACPIIEEYVKFFLLQCTSKLPRNFHWVEMSNGKRKTKRRVAEIVKRDQGDNDCTSANQYVTKMLAISVALKLADAARRILLYTKPTDANKGFYALCRGVFPIHELCGAMIAIAFAKRDLLGMDVPRWKILAPAMVIHAMANFRGKRPIFKWNASSPWSEMQLSPLNIPDSSTFLQLVKKGYAKLMWIVTISRVFGYCVKNYYMVNRHALKRNIAELVTAESLKNLKKAR